MSYIYQSVIFLKLAFMQIHEILYKEVKSFKIKCVTFKISINYYTRNTYIGGRFGGRCLDFTSD